MFVRMTSPLLLCEEPSTQIHNALDEILHCQRRRRFGSPPDLAMDP
jgi:hypothetical protein